MLFGRALIALVLVGVVAPSPASAQSGERRHDAGPRRGRLGANQPNPFATETTIPFTVGADSCTAGTERHVVTIRIFNILSQVVAVPVLADTGAVADSARAVARPVSNLELACGSYQASWNGRQAPDSRRAAPGVYMYQLLIDGHASGMRKMLVARP